MANSGRWIFGHSIGIRAQLSLDPAERYEGDMPKRPTRPKCEPTPASRERTVREIAQDSLKGARAAPVIVGFKMAERKLRVVTVECPECGLRAELREKAEGGPKTHFDDVVSACRHKLGNDILGCPSLRAALSAAHQSLRM